MCRAGLGWVLAGLLLTACATPKPKGVLFYRLGGLPAIEAVVSGVLERAVADERINVLFEGVDLPYLHDRLVEQLCQATGGPCTYTGLPMDEAHLGMGITDAEFDFFVEDLVDTMTDLGVPAAEQQEIAELLLPMRPDVVGL